MERFLLYLDNLDDLFFALRFVGERRGRTLLATLFLSGLSIAAVLETGIAVSGASLSAASLLLFSALLLYQAATVPHLPK